MSPSLFVHLFHNVGLQVDSYYSSKKVRRKKKINSIASNFFFLWIFFFPLCRSGNFSLVRAFFSLCRYSLASDSFAFFLPTSITSSLLIQRSNSPHIVLYIPKRAEYTWYIFKKSLIWSMLIKGSPTSVFRTHVGSLLPALVSRIRY